MMLLRMVRMSELQPAWQMKPWLDAPVISTVLLYSFVRLTGP